MQGMIVPTKQPIVVAVSGGVDSVALLDMLARSNQPLIVGHINHGIRDDSDDDEEFVKKLAASYGVPFVATRLKLGMDASEDAARQARYRWLDQVRESHGAEAVATAHHQDDVLETMVINIVRGTGWRGLCSLRETENRQRPLLGLSKAEIIDYALEHNLDWREDSTNESFKYLRNRIRSVVIPRLATGERHKLLELYDSQCILREKIDTELTGLLRYFVADGAISRHVLIMIEDGLATELLRSWLGESLEQARLRDLLLFAKTARAGAKWSLDGRRFIVAKQQALIVSPPRD